MNPDWISVLSEIQPYTQVLEPKQLYLSLIGLLPKGKYYLKYTKGKGEIQIRRMVSLPHGKRIHLFKEIIT